MKRATKKYRTLRRMWYGCGLCYFDNYRRPQKREHCRECRKRVAERKYGRRTGQGSRTRLESGVDE